VGSARAVRVATAAGGLTAALSLLAILLVILSVADPTNTAAQGYVHLAYVALAVFVAVLVIALSVQRLRLEISAFFAWVVGAVSVLFSLVPVWGLAGGNTDLGVLIYRGLKVPQGIVQFWDLDLVMLSVDCSRFGFDIYQDNNGCMQDASIYGPGVAWLRFVPFGIFSRDSVMVLGVLMAVASSLALVWLARQSRGLGSIVLLVAAVGVPWLLLLERGNIDAVVIWVAVATVMLTRRWHALWAWWLAAAAIWIVGTWKYYPFVLGLLLIPALRLRRGWTVLAGYLVASVGFVALTWSNFRFSSSSNSAMIDYGDYVVLGRIPVVARMLGSETPSVGLQWGDVLLFALVVAAAVWGWWVVRAASVRNAPLASLATGGAALYLASVVIAGFGYAYKATFLLLAVPMLAVLLRSRQRVAVASSVAVLLLVGVQSIVVWNTVLATLAGVVAAGFAFGVGTNVMWRVFTRAIRQVRVAS